MKNKLKGLYGITSQDMLLDSNVLFKSIEQALKGGMSILQYRNKHTPRIQSKDELIQLKKLCHRYNALFIINDNVELCTEIDADGVHLGKDDVALVSARKLLGMNKIIGVSCYNDVTLAQQATKQGADYIAFGAFYVSPTKPNAAIASINLIQQAKDIGIPICCIGGITPKNSKALIQKGAQMIAVISELFNTDNIQLNAESFSQYFSH